MDLIISDAKSLIQVWYTRSPLEVGPMHMMTPTKKAAEKQNQRGLAYQKIMADYDNKSQIRGGRHTLRLE